MDVADLTLPSAMPSRGVLLALDVSRKRIGLAVCDPDRMLVTPLLTIIRSRWASDLDAIAGELNERQAVGLVVGHPLNMDGTAGTAAQSRRDTAMRLAVEVNGIPVMLQDERLTTQAVVDAFKEGRWPRSKGRAHTDHFAAAIILEDAMRSIDWAHRTLASPRYGSS